ncbi:MAG: class I SAM-dependent methyltransferase [Anaerolineae bacterium]|nr:class I SAM-dependent methyltransferase [Anaerolineae bacterium]
MDAQTQARLNDINRAFYATTAADFDQTRSRPWPGWLRLQPYVKAPLRVLDVGCGNGRFGLFLAEAHPAAVSYHGLDNSTELLSFAEAALAQADFASYRLSEFDLLTQALPDASYDLVVLFGVIHHVPGAEQRQKLLRALAARVATGGYLCFAAWCFYEYERFRERLVSWPDDLVVEQHDYLLDWRAGEHALRYCHYVDEAEHTALIAASGLQEVETFREDGSGRGMNRYSILHNPT